MKNPSPNQKRLAHKTVLHILTGSISAYKAVELIQRLRQEGARVVCVMTESAKQFVTPLVVRAFSGEKVYHDFFSSDSPYDVVHTSLAEQADVILVAPASANFIARASLGLADDLASSVLLAARRPVLIAPAMNDQMYFHPLTQQNIEKLKGIGYRFVDPIEGELVCGKNAMGHLSAIETISDAVGKAISDSKQGNRSRR